MTLTFCTQGRGEAFSSAREQPTGRRKSHFFFLPFLGLSQRGGNGAILADEGGKERRGERRALPFFPRAHARKEVLLPGWESLFTKGFEGRGENSIFRVVRKKKKANFPLLQFFAPLAEEGGGE